jgi:hypothetical protein
MQHNLCATSYQDNPRDMVRDAISLVESSLPGFCNTTLLTCFHATECVPMWLACFVTRIMFSLSHSQSRRMALKDSLSWPGAFLIDCEKRLHCPTSLVRCLRAVPAVGSTFQVPTPARFPARCVPHLLPELPLLACPPTLVMKKILPCQGHRPSVPSALVVLPVSEQFYVSSI